ncbi:MAG: hypothetical protein AABM29_03775 [Actinomycetota bacterium]
MIYRAIGKAVVRLGVAFVRRRYGTQLRFAFGFALAAAAIGAYLAARDVPEG